MITLKKLEEILYRETSIIWSDDAELLMRVIRTEAMYENENDAYKLGVETGKKAERDAFFERVQIIDIR